MSFEASAIVLPLPVYTVVLASPSLPDVWALGELAIKKLNSYSSSVLSKATAVTIDKSFNSS